MIQKANQQQTKEHNRQLILKTIYQQTGISRADLSRATHLTRTTVSDLVNELIQTGFLQETGKSESAGGKPAILLELVDEARMAACLDLGGSSFKGALTDLRGKMVYEVEHKQHACFRDGGLECIQHLLDDLLSKAAAPVAGIGVGTPGLVNPQRGIIRRAVNLGWEDLPLKQILEERYGLPVYVVNDSHAAALADFTFGNYSLQENLIAIKIGRGVGAGMVINGRLHYGDSFVAGEIGHLRVAEPGLLCSCGNQGCLETVASSRAVLSRLSQANVSRRQPSGSQGEADPLQELHLDEVIAAYQAGEQQVKAVINEAARYLGMAAACLALSLDIHTVVVGGSWTGFGEGFLRVIQDEMDLRKIPSVSSGPLVQFSTLGSRQVISGAAALVLSQELGLP